MREVNDRQSKDLAAKQAKEKELSKVKINREDVDLIVSVYNWLILSCQFSLFHCIEFTDNYSNVIHVGF